jgi:SNF2 family DNA or RNA helicase
LAKDTIEEKIRSLQERKMALGKELFRGGEEMPQLDRADLEMLLG